MGHLAALSGQAEDAAYLFGAAEALYETAGFQLPHHDPKAYDPALLAMRATLDETTIAEGWTQGRALSLEHAIAEALTVAGQLADSARSDRLVAHPHVAAG